jgi:hypothetical protein
MGNGLRAAGQQGAEGLMATASASQAAQAAGASLLAGLRDQIAVSGKSTDELLRYRAAQAGVAAEAAPLILQLQNQRAAQQAAAEGARAEEAAQRANAAAKQQAAAAQESFLAGLRDQAALQGKTQTEVMRYRAAQLGVAEGAEQYIRALEQGASAHRVGALSAKEHAMAMRMLPMQMPTYDGAFKLQIATAENVMFDERLQAAKVLIDECINEWAKGSRPEIIVLVQQAFQTDKEGNLNVGRILALRRLEITDERWKEAMKAIGESVQVIGTKQYVRIYERVGDTGRYVPIPLDMVAV